MIAVYHNLTATGIEDGLSYVTVQPDQLTEIMNREECTRSYIDFDDVIHGWGCQNRLVAVPRLVRETFQGFDADLREHNTPELLSKFSQDIPTGNALTRVKHVIATHNDTRCGILQI
jgi:hypothetical protein